MKKTNPKIIITLFSIIIGVFISVQMKMKVELYAPVTIKSIQSTKMEVDFITNEITELEKIIKTKEAELEILENISRGGENITDILSLDLQLTKSNSGRTAVQGPGIIITMYDNMDSQIIGFDVNDDIVHDVDIQNILNDLKYAGAEAISINGERVVSSSEIQCNGPVMRINGKSSGTPFVIKAIGDPKVLMASVNAPGTYGDTLRTVYFIGFEPHIEDKIVIPAYKGNFRFTYAKQVGEGD